MNSKILSILFFVTSALASSDNWDAPPKLQAYMAFQIIWAALSLIQLVWILKNLRKIPSMAARGPYIMLVIVTFFTFLLYLLGGISTRVTLYWVEAGKLSASITVFYALVTAFQPAVILWLIHQRGALLGASKGNGISPFTSQIWKQVLDWVLVAVTFILYIASAANRASFFTDVGNGKIRNIQQFLSVDHGLAHTLVALSIVLAIDVAISSIALLMQGKRAQWNDLVTARICHIVVPFFVVYALSSLIFDIYFTKVTSSIVSQETLSNINLASVIIEGICRLAITSGLILTMSLRGVQWTPARGVPLHPETAGQWSDPKHEGAI